MGDGGGDGDVVSRRLQSGRRVQVPVQGGVVCIGDVKNGPRWWCELREAQ
jgi:hypothetical protein